MIYIDPAWIQRHFLRYPGRVIFSRYPEPMDGLPEGDLPPADLILITHPHQDHYKVTTVERLTGPDTTILAPKRLSGKFSRPVTVVQASDRYELAGAVIEVVEAYNTSEGRSTRKQHKQGEGVGFVIETGGVRLYHAGDTDVIPEMDEVGRIDIAFLPIGGTFTMDPQEAATAAARIKPKLAIPMHWLKADPNAFQRALSAIDPTIEVVVPATGQTVFNSG